MKYNSLLHTILNFIHLGKYGLKSSSRITATILHFAQYLALVKIYPVIYFMASYNELIIFPAF